MAHCKETIAALKDALAKAEALEQAESANASKDPIEIVIGQRGWVWIGRVKVQGDDIVISDARVIRQWGTTKGLAELCAGPTSKTVLDAPVPNLTVGKVNVLGRLGTTGIKWLEMYK